MPHLNHDEMDRLVDALRAFHGMNAADHTSALLQVAKNDPMVFCDAIEDVHNSKPFVNQAPVVEMYKVLFHGYDAKVSYSKISSIKVCREVTGKSLYDAKALVESAPQTVAELLSREQAEEMAAKFNTVGGMAGISKM